MTGTLTKGLTDELNLKTAMPVTGAKAGDNLDSVVLADLDKQGDFPLRLYASATPDAFVNLSASTTAMGDGGTKVSPPITGVGPAAFASGKINFGAGTGTVTGLGTITLNGAAFAATFAALTKTNNQWRRFVFTQQSDGSVAVVTSAEAASEAALSDYGALATQAGGSYVGHIDVVGVTGGFYKSNASASQIIGNDAVFRVGGGGGGGGSASAALALQSASTPNLTLTSGVLPLTDGREVASWDSGGTDTTNYGKTLVVSATTIFGSTPANATIYYLYLDLDSLAATPDTIATGTQTGRKVYPVTVANFVLLTTTPDAVNRARYVYRGTVKSATSGNAWSGTGAELWSATTLQGNNGPVATSLIASRPATGSAVGAVGSTGQIARGHHFSTKSYRSGVTAAFYEFDSVDTITDKSGGGRTLTNNGSVAFNQADIFNVANGAARLTGSTSVYLSSVDALFDQATANNWEMLLWVSLDNWNTTTYIASVGNSSNNVESWGIQTVAGSGIRIGTQTFNSPYYAAAASFAGGSYHAIGVRYVAADLALYLYVDGVRVATMLNSDSGLAAVGANRKLAIGGLVQSAGLITSPFTGNVSDVIFINDASNVFTDADWNKLHSYRFDHNTGVATKNQRWSASVYPNGNEPAYQLAPQWLISKGDTNSVFWDLSDLGSTDAVDIILEDLGLSPFVIPAVSPYDNVFVTTLPGSVAHGQPDVPEVTILVETGSAGVWAPVASEGKVTVDAANITFLDTMPVPAASPNRVWVVGRSRKLATVGVPDANTSRSGVVTIGDQDFAGVKRMQSALRTTTLATGANQTIGNTSDSLQVLTPSANINVTLDNTHKGGRVLRFVNLSASFYITLKSNDGTVLRTLFPSSNVTVQSLQDVPTGVAHWECMEPGSSPWLAFTPTLQGSSNGSVFTNVNFSSATFFRREFDSLHFRVQANFTGTPGTGTGAFALVIPSTIVPNSFQHNLTVDPSGNYAEVGTALTKSGGTLFQQAYNVVPQGNSFASSGNPAFYVGQSAFSPTVPGTYANGDYISYDFLAPVTGWTATKG